MISINHTSTVSTVKTVDRSVVSTCLLGFSNLGTGLSGISAVLPVSGMSPAGFGERNERPIQASAAVAAAGVKAYASAAAGAGTRELMTQHHLTQHQTKWAFRGLEPWSDPT